MTYRITPIPFSLFRAVFGGFPNPPHGVLLFSDCKS